MQSFQGGKVATEKLQSFLFGGILQKIIGMVKLKQEPKNMFDV